ncbi:MAG: FG-GAP-like repeat-containing protein, partial [Flavobacteriaceae bacterium]|nr:FG-GAP-like repeat-containing protein [Flavobacteriaceae bacterium]
MLFQIVTYAQSISSFSPKSGISGTSVTITGSGFNSTLSSNIVYMSGVKCTVTAASTTSLTVTIPSGGVTGKFMYSNSGTAKVCQSGVPFIMAYNAIPAANTYNCSTSTLVATSVSLATPGPSTLASSVKITDVDEDGKPDIMSSYGQFIPMIENIHVQVSKNTSTSSAIVAAGNFTTSDIYYNNSTNAQYSFYPQWIHLNDLNGDGRLDVTMLSNSTYTVNNRIIRNAGTAISTANYPVQAQTGFLTNIETNGDWLDINRNGTLDFISNYSGHANAANDRLKLFANTSSGNTLGLANAIYSASASANQQIKPSADNIAWSIIKTVDFDNDGDEDVFLVSRNATGTTSSNCRIYLLKNNGNNTLYETNFTLTGVLADLGAFSSVSVTDVSFADFDNDGLYDVAVLLNGNNVKVFKNTSSGGNISLGTPVSFNNGNTINQSLSINDFDNDGKADILIAGKGGVKLIQNLTTGSTLSFGNEVNLKTWTYYGIPSIQVCDLNADGIPELVGVEDTALLSNSYRNLVVYSYIAPPTITVNSNLSAFTSCGGFASTAQSFTVAGTNLTANVTVGALSGFEYSTNGTTFSTNLSLAPTSGTLATTTVYVRSASSATGTLSGNIVVTSTTCGAPTINVAANRAVTASIDYQPSALTNTCLNSDPQTLYVSTTGTNLSYQWYVNTTNSTVGATAISGATNDYYDVPTNVAGTKYYYVVVTASCGQMVSTINSQVVGSSPAAKLISFNLPSIVCLNSTTVASVSTTGSSQIYWQTSSNNINWTYLSLGNNYTIPTNVVGRKYYRVRMLGACGGYIFTDSYAVTVQNILPGTIAATNSTLCSGQSTSIAITGNVGTIQWQISSNGTSNWTNISGATGSSLNTGILNNTKYYRAKISTNDCVVYSNTQTITVNPLLGYLGAISGTSNVTGLSSTTYSVPAVSNANSYVWLLPVG